MNLILDVGNSFVKLAVFEQNIILDKEKCLLEDFFKKIKKKIKSYPEIEKCILSSVVNLDEDLLNVLKKELQVLILDRDTPVPFKNLYATPKTLGIDRIALVSAAASQFPNRNVLVMDAGTCITYDFISEDSAYLGGAISPGITMRYKALHDYTAKLPLLEKEVPLNLIGDSTVSSIHSGIVNGMVQEIEGVVANYQSKFPDLTIILTGGDANFLSKQLKSSIFANSNFLLEGLNSILQFNSHE
ncbi:type III pantothenate kinase [Formosa sp. S-31]|uniref:type III pantothenate kinase n=1 Tax=Formosa sp. S-31 TaxID=2790949 RepID=UPI003EB91F6C